jgi:hypothetical protein
MGQPPSRNTFDLQIEQSSEASFAVAAAQTRNLSVQTRLGLSRDIRLFAAGERFDSATIESAKADGA